ncbi:MAG: DUF1819 family protein [Chloroflexi bacterium]|nr:DUF1819 family protein [Chloroflexota bacterium]MDA8187561.1 DUF1819 family protein [Dehalococcoidales bacterium]
MEQTPKFRARLQRGGLGFHEMRRLLEAYAEHGSFDRLKQQVFKENLLGKTSDRILEAMLGAFKWRFLEPLGLPPSGLIAGAMISRMSDAAKTQALFPYFVISDPLVEKCYRDLVLVALGSTDANITTKGIVEYLTKLSDSHPELGGWSESMRSRWAQGFTKLLRDFGLLERYPQTRLHQLWLLPEAFAFFWLWFFYQTGSYWETERQGLWELLQLEAGHRNELLAEGALHGWWHYQRLGEIVQFQPNFSSTEEWLERGLD